MINNNLCKNLTFNECELAILRSAVDKAEVKQGKNFLNSPEIKEIIYIVEEFMKEGGFTLREASSIMNDVKNLYLESGKCAEFNVWEVENNSGEIVQMYINQKI